MKKFQCTTCGKISTDKEEICQAQTEIGAVYVCHDCGNKSSRAEGICNPVKMTPSYFCGTCGNGAVEKRALCEPVKIAR
jgi:NAD-dependent SIR2 family protein deacetylase